MNLPFLKNGKLLIACSGGLDSVVLTHLCNQAKLNFSLAHCNFNLRSDESDADEDFIISLAEDLKIEVFIQNFETQAFAETQGVSIQMAARELRYDWFKKLASELQFDFILTAHHADDNLETFLINLSRGTGIDGLTGIPEINDNIIRPLLPFSRKNIEYFANSNGLKWREDCSNTSTKYLRNQLRHEVIPHLKATNEQFLENFKNTQKHLKNSKELIENALESAYKKVIKEEHNRITIHINQLQKLSNPNGYLYEFLKDFQFPEWNDVFDLKEAQSGKYVCSKTHRLLKDREKLILSEIEPVQKNTNEFITIHDKSVRTQLGTIEFTLVERVQSVTDNTIYIDKDLLKYPLSVRHWKKGDYFYPFGMEGKKKLSKFFKDEKYSLLDKEQALVLCSDDNIVWIINKRADNRYRITPTTNQILRITIL